MFSRRRSIYAANSLNNNGLNNNSLNKNGASLRRQTPAITIAGRSQIHDRGFATRHFAAVEPHTFNSKYSRSHELITSLKDLYSVSFTAQ